MKLKLTGIANTIDEQTTNGTDWVAFGQYSTIPAISTQNGVLMRSFIDVPINRSVYPIENIKRVTLVLTAAQALDRCILTIGTKSYSDISLQQYEKIYFDITDEYKSAYNDGESGAVLTLMDGGMNVLGVGYSAFVRDGENQPVAIIDYVSNNVWNEATSDFSVAGEGKASYDMVDGTHKSTFVIVPAEDSVLGQAITYTIDNNGQSFFSVKESLVETCDAKNRGYTHVDSLGNAYGIVQYFYFDDNGTKFYLQASRDEITIEADGTLKYGGQRVYPEYKSRTGVEVLPEIEGYTGSDCFDTRSDECREIEEQIGEYKEVLSEYVIVSEDNTQSIDAKAFSTKFSNCIDSEEDRKSFIAQAKEEGKLLLTKSDAINYESLCMQLTSIAEQRASYAKSESAEDDAITANLVQIDNILEQIELMGRQKLQIENKHSDNFAEKDDAITQQQYYFNLANEYDYAAGLALNNSAYATTEEDKKKYLEEYDKLCQNKKIATCNAYEFGRRHRQFVLIVKANPAQSFDEYGEFIYHSTWSNTEGDVVETFDTLAETGSYYVMTRAEALSYMSILMQISQLNEQKTSLLSQNTALGADNLNENAQLHLNTQENAVILQKNTYTSYQPTIIAEFERKAREYTMLCKRLEDLKVKEVVCSLKDGEIIKGFNKDGRIVSVADLMRGKQAWYEYESGRVSRLYDEDGNEVKFEYNSNGILLGITDAKGNRVTYDYGNGTTTIIYPNDVRIILHTANGELTEVVNDYLKTATAFGYDAEGRLNMIEQKSGEEIISVKSIEYETDTDRNIILTITSTPDSTRTRYKVARDKEVLSRCTEIAGKMVEAVRYDGVYLDRNQEAYLDEDTYVLTTYAYKRDNLVGKAFDDFVFEDDKCMICRLYPDFYRENKPKKVEITGHSDENIESEIVNYYYDIKRRLVDEESILALVAPEKTYITHTLYSYDNNGYISKTESFVEGEEDTRGKDITEYVYDKYGRELNRISYNTLSHSDKMYTEKEYDDTDRLVCEYDERGMYKTLPVYGKGEVIGAKYPNGSTFVKCRDKYGNVIAVTQSTDIGEENCTDRCYTEGKITSLKSGNTTIGYTYDGKKRITAVNLNGTENYVTKAYGDDETFYRVGDTEQENAITVDRVSVTTQGVGTKTTYVDKAGRVIEESFNGDVTSYIYNDKDLLTSVHDGATLTNEAYVYDDKDNLTAFTRGAFTEAHTYAPTGEVIESNVGALAYTYTYTDDSRRELKDTTVSGESFIGMTDPLGRNTGKEVYKGNDLVARTKINYVKHGDHTTGMPSTVQYMNGSGGVQYTVSKTLKYAYDSMGNISKVLENGKLKFRYEYDTLGRLTREDNLPFAKTWTYIYDDNGNILEKRTYTFTLCDTPELEEKSYTSCVNLYSPTGDRAEMINGSFVYYDDIGRVSQYNYMDCTWEKGKLVQHGTNTYTYDYAGRRISKNGITYTYDSQGRLVEQSNGIRYIYDHTGVAGIIKTDYNTLYFYEKDIQGNIISILDSLGYVVVRYEYDAWGVCKVYDQDGRVISDPGNIGHLNPFRYRSYYYDTETSLYYLPARYYDPTTGRFVSADDIEYADPEVVNGLNLYAYCGNNPVMNVDPSGHGFFALLVGALLLGGLAFGATAYADYKDDGEVFNGSIAWYDYAGATLLGGLTGGFLGGAFVGASLTASLPSVGLTGGALAVGTTGVIAGTVTGTQVLTGVATLGGLYLFAKWKPGSWPGDDPSVSPGDDFIWRGPGRKGSSKGEWYNPKTGDQLHPDLNHPLPKGPHWGWRNKILKILQDIFK